MVKKDLLNFNFNMKIRFVTNFMSSKILIEYLNITNKIDFKFFYKKYFKNTIKIINVVF